MFIVRVGLRSLIESGLFILFGAISLIEARHLYLTKDPALLYARMQPGFYIAFLGALLIALGIAHLLAEVMKEHVAPEPQAEASPESTVGRNRILWIVVSLVAYMYLIGIIGYVLASAAFFVVVLTILGVRPFPTGIVFSIAFTAVIYFIFVQFCDVVWPAGTLINFP